MSYSEVELRELALVHRPSSFPFLLSTLAYQSYVNIESNHRTEWLSGKITATLNEAHKSGLSCDRIPRDKITGLQRLTLFKKRRQDKIVAGRDGGCGRQLVLGRVCPKRMPMKFDSISFASNTRI